MSESAQGTSPSEGLYHHLDGLTQAVKGLQAQYIQLEDRLQGSAASPAPGAGATPDHAIVTLSREPEVPLPERFSGNRSQFRTFQSSCELYLALQPLTFSLETTKVGLVVSLLSGPPQVWAHQLLRQKGPETRDLAQFFQAMAAIYDDPYQTATAEAALRALQQGRRPVEDYAVEFRQWAGDTTWNDPALGSQFRAGLSGELKDELARVGVPQSLEALINLAIQLDRRLRERRSEKAREGSTHPASPPRMPLLVSRPLGLSRPHLSAGEWQRRRSLGLCLYCGEPGHQAGQCPTKSHRPATPKESVPLMNLSPHLSITLSIQLGDRTLVTQAVIDSGACSCFVDLKYAATHQIPLRPKTQGMVVKLADGTSIKSGLVTQESVPLPTCIGDAHHELLILDAIASPLSPIILGLPWLRAHNPTINWTTGSITFSSPYCQRHCLSTKVGKPSALLGILPEPEAMSVVPQAYHQFLDVFSRKGAETLPPHRPYDCPIELLPGAAIPFGRIYPLTEAELATLKAYIEENLQKGFIRPSTSPAGAGIFFVEKKDQSLRPCIDYRELNKVTVKNRYPLPLVPELFQRLGTARIFTKLDLRGAYNLVRIRKGDEWKTAFRTRFGHYEYLVMPFGLCNAPATFQHLVNDVFRDYLDRFVIVYLDDILIFSASLEEHRHHVASVLTRLRQHGLYAKAEKCEFEQTRISFLGLVISNSGLAMDPQKVSAIIDWPAPMDKKGVQRFIGFANFYRWFIKGFSSIIAPITHLTKAQVRFRWTSEAQEAFSLLKTFFTSAPILRHPDPALPFTLEVDASEIAVGAILSQRQGAEATLHPVAFFSRKLSPPERNYDVGDRELLAIKAALEEWRYLLEGARHPILVFTDHRNLEYLRSAKRLRPRQARWALFFARFQFHVTYRPGSKNVKPDALSRMYCQSSATPPQDTILPARNFLLTQRDIAAEIRRALAGAPPPQDPRLVSRDGLLWAGNRLFVPETLRPMALGICHDHKLAGHYGASKTIDLVLRTFWWPNVASDCREYVASCRTCTQNKDSRTKAWGLLNPLPVPDRAWSELSMDFIVELPPSQGFTTVFVVVDRLTKMAHFIPMKGTPTARQTADTFIKEIVRLHGLPRSIVSDRGAQFTSRFWRALCTALDIEQRLSSAYHPQTNGQTERTNQTLEQYLRCFSSFAQDDWSSLLPLAEFSYNNTTHSATKQSPFMANYGFHPSFIGNLNLDNLVPAVQITTQSLQENSQLLQETLRRAQERTKETFDRGRRGDLNLLPGTRVWLATRNLRLACPSKKLGPRFIGPFPVRRRINRVAYELELPPALKIHPVFHVALLRPEIANPFPGRRMDPPGPILVDGEEEFEVEAILDRRRRGNTVQYLIKWKGFGPENNSWEPVANIHAPALLRAFERNLNARRARPGIRRLPLGGGNVRNNH